VSNVYRVEGPDKRGPYINEFRLSWLLDKHNYCPDHPSGSLDQDLYDFINKNYMNMDDCRYGFVSLEQLHRWFSELDLGELRRLGFSIMEYQAEIVASSQYQCLFRSTGLHEPKEIK